MATANKPSDFDAQQMDKEVEKWKVKKLIRNLQSARGNGTSMITLMLTPKDQLARMTKMLQEEYGTASNIKSHVNKLSVLTAITSVLQRLKLYNKVPLNGLAIYCGTIVTEENKEKKVTIDFEPFKPISRTMYMCDNKFHTEPLNAMLESDDKFGFIIMDGNGTLFGLLQGNARDVLHRFTVELPKKHGRGGQSALRFARLRLEKRHNYIRKVAELATQLYITNDKPNVSGIVLAGSADFKNDLQASDLFDNRLQPIVMKIVDVAYGGDNGFNQAIDLAADVLSNLRFVQEKKLVGKYFQEISMDSARYCYGIEDTIKALDMGAVSILLVWEDLPHERVVLNLPDPEAEGGFKEKVLIMMPDKIGNEEEFQDEQGNTYEFENVQLVEWLAENYKRFGCALEFVTNKSHEGNQFVRGFGGIGGLLRYQVDFAQMHASEQQGHAEEEDKDDAVDTPAPTGQVQWTDDDFM